MKKSIFLALVLMSAVGIAGCTTKEQPTEKAVISADQPVEESISEWQKVGKALENGQAVSCEMTDTENGISSRYFMKEQKVRFETVSSDDATTTNGSFISDGEYGYSWSEDTKKGMKFAVNAPENMADDADAPEQEAPDFSSKDAWDQYQNQGYTIVCEVTSVDDAVFTPPADVTFTDLSAFTQQKQEMNVGDQEQLQKMMEQFKDGQ